MLTRTRVLVAILLLATAAVHPLVHFAEQDCPCAHGAAPHLDAPGVARYAPVVATHAEYVPVSVSATLTGELPARAPPAV
jgi:hypothetical protein